MKKATIYLYEFQELNENAQQIAICEHREFMISTERPDYIDGVVNWDDPEKMEMYNAQIEYYEDNDEPIIEAIEANNYLFFQDGKLAHTTCYTYNHEKAGKTELHFKGSTYTVEDTNE